MSETVDLTALRECTDGDREMEQMLLEEFRNSSKECIGILSKNCLDGENEEWRRSAHSMKGMALNLGANHLAEFCKDAQEKQDSSAEEKKNMLASIKNEYEKVEAFLASL